MPEPAEATDMLIAIELFDGKTKKTLGSTSLSLREVAGPSSLHSSTTFSALNLSHCVQL